MPESKYQPASGGETETRDSMAEQRQDDDRAVAELTEAHTEILQKIEFHEGEAEKLKDTLHQMGFDYETHRQREDDEDSRMGQPSRARNQGRRRRNNGQGRVTSPDDRRLKENSSAQQEEARHQSGDGRGQVRDPSHDRRLKQNQG